MPGWYWKELGRYRRTTADISLKGEKRESLGNNKHIRKYFNSILV